MGHESPILIDGMALKNVKEYTYLGQQISYQDKMEKNLTSLEGILGP